MHSEYFSSNRSWQSWSPQTCLWTVGRRPSGWERDVHILVGFVQLIMIMWHAFSVRKVWVLLSILRISFQNEMTTHNAFVLKKVLLSCSHTNCLFFEPNLCMPAILCTSPWVYNASTATSLSALCSPCAVPGFLSPYVLFACWVIAVASCQK